MLRGHYVLMVCTVCMCFSRSFGSVVWRIFSGASSSSLPASPIAYRRPLPLWRAEIGSGLRGAAFFCSSDGTSSANRTGYKGEFGYHAAMVAFFMGITP
jgi:hypothetical protein